MLFFPLLVLSPLELTYWLCFFVYPLVIIGYSIMLICFVQRYRQDLGQWLGFGCTRVARSFPRSHRVNPARTVRVREEVPVFPNTIFAGKEQDPAWCSADVVAIFAEEVPV